MLQTQQSECCAVLLNPVGAAAAAPLEGLRHSLFNLGRFIFSAGVCADVLRARQPGGHMLQPVRLSQPGFKSALSMTEHILSLKTPGFQAPAQNWDTEEKRK